MNIILKLLMINMIVLFTMTLSGCGRSVDVDEINKKLEDIKTEAQLKQSKEAILLPTLPASVVYKYQDVVHDQVYEEEVSSPDGKSPTSNKPLEAYPINSYEYLGILIQDGVNYGYVMAPDNFVYNLEVGDKLGNTGAIISDIKRDYIEVSTKAKDGSVKNKTTLKLKD